MALNPLLFEELGAKRELLSAIVRGVPVEQSKKGLRIRRNHTHNELTEDKRLAFEKLVHSGAVKKWNHNEEPSVEADVLFVPKADGSLRTITDFRESNQLAPIYPFKYEPIDPFFFKGARYAASLDLSDGYHHMQMDPQYYRLMGVRFDEEPFEAKKLPFGLAVAPSYFSSMMSVLVRHLRRQQIKITYYLDDILIVGKSQQEVRRAVESTIALFKNANLKINIEKSRLSPTKIIDFRGWTFLFGENEALVILQQTKRAKLAQFCQDFKNPTTIGDIQKLSGYLEFAFTFHKDLYITKTRVARLLAGNKSKEKSKRIRLTTETEQIVRNIPTELARIKPIPLSVEPRSIVIATDASMDGAGCIVFDSGQTLKFGEQEGKTIALKELRTVGSAVKAVTPNLPMGSNILIYCDNKNAIAALEGRAKSQALSEEGQEIRKFAREEGVFLEVRYISTRENIIADALSREKNYDGENSGKQKLPAMITIPPQTPKSFYDPLANPGMWPEVIPGGATRRPKTGGPARRQAVIDGRNNQQKEGSRNLMRRIHPAPRITNVEKLPPEMQEQARLSIGHGSFRKRKGNFIVPLPTITDDEGNLYLEGSQIHIVEDWLKESFRSNRPEATIRHKVGIENSPLSFWLQTKRTNTGQISGLSKEAKEFLMASTKKTTRDNYTSVTRRFITFMKERKHAFKFKEINIDHILQFLQHLREEDIQPQTMRNYLSGILATAKTEAPDAFRRIIGDPLLTATRRTIGSLASSRAAPKIIKEGAFGELNAQFILNWGSKRRTWDDQAMTVIAVMLLTGARIGEAVRTRNPMFGKDKIEINTDLSLSIICATDDDAKGLKSRRVCKKIPLLGISSPQGELIQQMIMTRHDCAPYLCFNHIPTEKEFTKLIRRVRTKLRGLGIKPHDFRRSFAQKRFRELITEGMSRDKALSVIREELGHSSHDAILSYGNF
eukprot:TRINITY_DN3295_c3_g4_i2.p1 TRINITY_DN3295_c3_g4~~TRINITY_DN3295_c3_g4_i2.p1  ORF type:complete len:952 (+),score=19.05 TRINITY_DN3295_c3_g4_i2:886-3741(+)